MNSDSGRQGWKPNSTIDPYMHPYLGGIVREKAEKLEPFSEQWQA